MSSRPAQNIQNRKSRRHKATVKPILESVEERILPSVSSAAMLPLVSVASPPAAPAVAAVTSYVESTLDQWASLMATVQQDLSNVYTALTQELSLEAAYGRQVWDQFLGINPTPQNQPSNNATQAKGSGSGSDGGATTHAIVPRPGNTKVQPLDSGSGVGSDAGPGSGGGTGYVNGQVWLDNNGNGNLDNKELGFSGIMVWLCNSTGQQIQSTTTDSNGNYQFTVSGGNLYGIQVIIPTYDYATIPGYSQINAAGFTQVYTLAANGSLFVPAGIRSMNVTTTQDDPNGPIPNQITLRDAIETGNNGPPAPAVTFYKDQQGDPLTGTIALQAALPAVATSYNINGPQSGPSSLTVEGNSNASTIFTVNAGVTSTISLLTITGGSGRNGGGILNKGNLTMFEDDVVNNDAADGGGIYNDTGAQLSLHTVSLSGNTATASGGGLENWGTVIISEVSVVQENADSNGGGGIYNGPYATISALDGTTKIQDNSNAVALSCFCLLFQSFS